MLKPEAEATDHSEQLASHVVVPDITDEELLGAYHRLCVYRLAESTEAQRFLGDLGLADGEMLSHFQIGFVPATTGRKLPLLTQIAGDEVRSRLEKIGILRSTGNETLANCLVIPIFNDNNTLVHLYGRRRTDSNLTTVPVDYYVPAKPRGVWNQEALIASKEIILCDGLIQGLSFWCAGFRNVTSSYGWNGFTDDLFDAFKVHHTKRVLIAYGSNKSADRSALKIAMQLHAEGVQCFRIEFPKPFDANEYSVRFSPSSDSLGRLISSARFLGNGEPPEIISVQHAVPVDVLPVKISTVEADAVKDVVVEKQPVPTDVATELNGDGILINLGDRRYRIRGLARNHSYEALKVNLFVGRGEAFHLDTLDLYQALQRARFIKTASSELGLKEEIIKNDLGKVLLKAEAIVDEQIHRLLEPKVKTVTMTAAEESAAMELLRDPTLLDRIADDLGKFVVGERTNLLVGYLAATSRLLDRPLGVIVQSSSAAGKSSLVQAVLEFMPDESKLNLSCLTGQSLFYLDQDGLRNKVLSVAEEAGIKDSYALKLLASEGNLSIATVTKDNAGKLKTETYSVAGPCSIFLTTTSEEIDPELENRCILLNVDEGRQQTMKIHHLQRVQRTLEGLRADQERKHVQTLHQNAQRLLRPLHVVNSYAPTLTFLDTVTRTRRDHIKYLTLISSIALLHQFQRPVKTVAIKDGVIEYVEVTKEDIRIANQIAAEAFGSISDELSAQARILLKELATMVASACEKLSINREDFRFTRKDVREFTGWTHFQVRLHLPKLIELELVVVHRGSHGKTYEYELAFDSKLEDGQTGSLLGLFEPDQLVPEQSANLVGQNANLVHEKPNLVGTWCELGDSVSAYNEKAETNLVPKNERHERGIKKVKSEPSLRFSNTGRKNASEK